ncbi:MAG: zf-HC2 domain-containing protein [Oscillospiraceae bacterium]
MTKCNDYREMMSQMLDDELTEPQKAELLSHISACPDCARVYSAFAFLSSSIDEGAEPPETLCADVMSAIRAGNIVPISAAKKRSRAPAKFLALAACMALVVFAASKVGIFSAPGTPGDISAPAAQTLDPSNANADDARFYLESDSTQPLTPEDGEANGILPEISVYSVGADSRSADAGLLGVSSVALFSGDLTEPTRDPIAIVTDEESLLLLINLLDFSEMCDETAVSGDPVFIFDITPTEGEVYSVSVWISDGRLYCRSDEDNLLYVAAGDAGTLFDFIAAA